MLCDCCLFNISCCVLFFYPEPNLLSGTAHSVNKRGVKRRDLDVEELKDILSPLLPFVRTEHILPTNSDVLSDAVSALYRCCCCMCLQSLWSHQHWLLFCLFPAEKRLDKHPSFRHAAHCWRGESQFLAETEECRHLRAATSFLPLCWRGKGMVSLHGF